MKLKYKNKKVEVEGIIFDSAKEARRYRELRILQESGDIKNLQCQVKFILIPTQYEYYERYSEKTGKRLKDGRRVIEKECAYYADFVYIDTATGKKVVEDIKGYKDSRSAGFAKYVLKRKMMLYFHGIKIKEI